MKRIYTVNFEVGLHDQADNMPYRHGWFEHNEHGDECGGGLWFHDGALVDYDGVYELPREVVQALADQGIDVEYCNEESEND